VLLLLLPISFGWRLPPSSLSGQVVGFELRVRYQFVRMALELVALR